MTLLRTSFLLLVLANLAFFAWDRGYFGESRTGHEPQRLGAQFNADKITIVASAKPALEACRIVDNLQTTDADSLRTTLAQKLPELKLVSSPSSLPSAYDVTIPELGSRGAADSKLAELKRIGIREVRLVMNGGGKFSLVLARFQAEDAARDFISQKNLKTAKIVGQAPSGERVRLQVSGPEAAMQRLDPFTAAIAEAKTTECQTQ